MHVTPIRGRAPSRAGTGEQPRRNATPAIEPESRSSSAAWHSWWPPSRRSPQRTRRPRTPRRPVRSAASFVDQSGAQVETTVDGGGGQNVGWLSNGDWMRYQAINLGSAGDLTTSMRVAAAYESRRGTVEVRLDSLTGPLVAAIPSLVYGRLAGLGHQTDTGRLLAGRTIVPRDAQRPADGLRQHQLVPVSRGRRRQPNRARDDAPAHRPSTPSGSTMTASAMPSMTMPAPTAALGADRSAKWNAQLAEFNALNPGRSRPTTGTIAGVQRDLHVQPCRTGRPDRVPRNPGASHMHSFIGNNSTEREHDGRRPCWRSQRRAASHCRTTRRTGSPRCIENGQPVQPKEVIVYYGSLLADTSKTVPMPQGLR